MAQMLDDNPAMNEIVTAQQRGTLQVLYRKLADQYNFTPEEREYFYDLLLARQMGRVNFGLLSMRGNVTDEERAAALQHMQATDAQMRDDLRSFLNNDADFQAFDYYEQTMGVRMEMDAFANAVATQGEPLPEGAYDELLGVIHETRTSYPYTSQLGRADQQNPDLSVINEGNINLYADEMRQANELVIQAITPYLTTNQLEAFRRNQDQQLSLQLAQLRMAAQMFGGTQQ